MLPNSTRKPQHQVKSKRARCLPERARTRALPDLGSLLPQEAPKVRWRSQVKPNVESGDSAAADRRQDVRLAQIIDSNP